MSGCFGVYNIAMAGDKRMIALSENDINVLCNAIKLSHDAGRSKLLFHMAKTADGNYRIMGWAPDDITDAEVRRAVGWLLSNIHEGNSRKSGVN